MRTLLINYNKNSGIVFCKIKTPYKSENRRENKIILSSYSLLLFEPLCVVAFTIRSCVHLRKLQSLSQRYPRTHAFIIARMLASEPDANSMYPIICTQISQFSFQMILLRYLFVRNERRKSLAFRLHVLSYSIPLLLNFFQTFQKRRLTGGLAPRRKDPRTLFQTEPGIKEGGKYVVSPASRILAVSSRGEKCEVRGEVKLDWLEVSGSRGCSNFRVERLETFPLRGDYWGEIGRRNFRPTSMSPYVVASCRGISVSEI